MTEQQRLAANFMDDRELILQKNVSITDSQGIDVADDTHIVMTKCIQEAIKHKVS